MSTATTKAKQAPAPDASTAIKDAKPEAAAPDPDTGKLFDVPRVGVLVDDTDPTLLKLAFSGSVEIERGETDWIGFYNQLRAGKPAQLTVSVHVAGARNVHRRDKEGDVDAVVQTKSLIVTDVHIDE